MKTFEDAVRFHGHSCPGLAFGYRAAIAALRTLNLENISEDEEIVAIVENDSCAVDSVQVITGCTFGKGNLIFKNYGKQVYTFLKRPSGEGVRIAIDLNPPEETETEKEMWNRYAAGDRSAEVLKSVHSRKAIKLKAVIETPDSDLMKIERVNMPLPPEAKIYPSIRCALCNEKTAEPKARVKDGKIVCIPCFEA